ncbi:MAG: PilC/PilY family type IV pilus protein [Pseudomonadota bacterium]
MTNTRSTALAFFTSLVVTLAAGSAALADDTEVLTGRTTNPGPPNVMLVLDTSGSMNSEVVIGEDYDSSIDYCAEFQSCSCDAEKVFYARNTSGTFVLPNCAFDSYVNYNPDPLDAFNVFECAAARLAFDTAGYFMDRYAQFDPTGGNLTWGTVSPALAGGNPPGAERMVECAADFGTQGALGPGTSEAEVYPANGLVGPFTDDLNSAIDWSGTGDTYTFYTANFLNYLRTDTQETVSTRMEVLKDVAAALVTSVAGINLGIMRFSSNAEGGYVMAPISDVDDNADDLVETVEQLTAGGNTPLAETMYEASRYFKGQTVFYGASSSPATSVESSFQGDPPYDLENDPPNYQTPFLGECQENYIVLLTDGLPTNDTGADGFIAQDAGMLCSGNCLDELTGHLDADDLMIGPGFEGKQSIKTFTIGFNTDQQLLEDSATGRILLRDDNGDLLYEEDGVTPLTRPGYFVANSSMQLTAAFSTIIESVQTVGETLTAPAVSVNAFNRLTNRDDLFFALFEPSGQSQPHWDGNVKKYRLGSAPNSSSLAILDSNNRVAVDDDGRFLASSQSFWSPDVDGESITLGGMVSRFSTERNVYTDIVGGTLTADNNRIEEDNDFLLAQILGIEAGDRDPDEIEEERQELLEWARGVNPDGTVRRVMGDPLHSQPVILTYAGGSEANPDQALVIGTNDGYLHLIDTTPNSARGNEDLEEFAYIPSELLGNLARLRENAPALPINFDKNYGLDGPITTWIENDTNGVIDAGEPAYVYVGMRRGGRNYYSLDVSNRNLPTRQWKILGGQANGAFEELGFTWSAAVPADVNLGSGVQRVLFISGGYDVKQDDATTPVEDTMGRALYIVDAKSGTRLWWASSPDAPGAGGANHLALPRMTNSIPSSPRVLDVNQDGLADRVYVGDTAGQLWRFDVINANAEAGIQPTITGGVLADFGGETQADNRRFYHPPSVSRIIDDRYGSFLAVSLGSGFQASPLDTAINDRFYVYRDTDVFTPPVYPPSPPTEAGMLDVTDDVSPDVGQIVDRNGWFIRMEAAGEKVLSSAIAADNQIFFSSFLPSDAPPTCSPSAALGSGRLYSISILNGAPTNFNTELGPEPDDRWQDLDGSGIPPQPVLVFTEPECDDCGQDDDGNQNLPPGSATGCDDPFSIVTMIIGTDVVNPNICNEPRRTYWTQEDIDET